jgi:predicted site-specific integrase-resolvase
VVQERTTKRVVYASEVCERANIHKVTLWRWIRCGRIKPPGVVGGRNAWTETYITELLENAPTRACYQSMEAA